MNAPRADQTPSEVPPPAGSAEEEPRRIPPDTDPAADTILGGWIAFGIAAVAFVVTVIFMFSFRGSSLSEWWFLALIVPLMFGAPIFVLLGCISFVTSFRALAKARSPRARREAAALRLANLGALVMHFTVVFVFFNAKW